MNNTGLVNACAFLQAEKAGSLLETLVLLELRKRDRTVCYFVNSGECDFVVQEKGEVVQAIQVCHTLTDENRRRELAGLGAAMARFGLRRGVIVTLRQKDHIHIDGGEVAVMPAWAWCLEV